MYLASFNHGGRDLIGVRRGDDELIALQAGSMMDLIAARGNSLAALAAAGDRKSVV